VPKARRLLVPYIRTADKFKVDVALDDADASDFGALLQGGVANPRPAAYAAGAFYFDGHSLNRGVGISGRVREEP
jgi:hypothetical protein